MRFHEESRSNWSRIFPTLDGPNTGSGSPLTIAELKTVELKGAALRILNHELISLLVEATSVGKR